MEMGTGDKGEQGGQIEGTRTSHDRRFGVGTNREVRKNGCEGGRRSSLDDGGNFSGAEGRPTRRGESVLLDSLIFVRRARRFLRSRGYLCYECLEHSVGADSRLAELRIFSIFSFYSNGYS